MAKINVYFAEGYVIADDRIVRTKRRATMETIRRWDLHPLENTMEVVDSTEIDANGFVRGIGPEAILAANKART
jgi:hypothetical protein